MGRMASIERRRWVNFRSLDGLASGRSPALLSLPPIVLSLVLRPLRYRTLRLSLRQSMESSLISLFRRRSSCNRSKPILGPTDAFVVSLVVGPDASGNRPVLDHAPELDIPDLVFESPPPTVGHNAIIAWSSAQTPLGIGHSLISSRRSVPVAIGRSHPLSTAPPRERTFLSSLLPDDSRDRWHRLVFRTPFATPPSAESLHWARAG